MKTQTEILSDLDLLYEKNPLPTIESSVEPNGGVLNLDKALADNSECWDAIVINSAQLEKKAIILKSSLSETTENIYLKQCIIKKLVDDHFSVYFPTKEGLKKIEDVEEVDTIHLKYCEMDPSQEIAEIKKLNLIGDRVTFLDTVEFDAFCNKVLNSPDAFFNFINSLTLYLPNLFSDLIDTEVVRKDLVGALQWSFDTPLDMDIDWRRKYIHFEKAIECEPQTKPIPQFLQSSMSSPTLLPEPDKLYFAYLLKNRPDILKKIIHISLTNSIVSLPSFLNKREGLLSLALENCELESLNDFEDEENENPLLTTSLRFLLAQEINFSSKRLASLLNNSPNLLSLCLVDGTITKAPSLSLLSKKMANLKTLSLNSVKTSTRQINALINATPNLRELALANLFLSWEDSLNLKAPLIHLKDLSISSSFIFDDVYILVNSAPNLETLFIYSFDWTEYSEPLIQPDKPLKSLKKVILGQGKMAPAQLYSLLTNAPNLTYLELSSCYLDFESISIAPNSLPNLKKLITRGTHISSDQLLYFFLAARNLNEIEMDNPDDLLTLLNALEPASLSSLRHITFSLNALSFSQLNQLIKVAPNVKSISFPTPRNKEDLIAIQWVQHSYPQIEINLFEPHLKQIPQYGYTEDSLSLDGNIGETEHTPSLPARTIFKTKTGPSPHVSSYHLNTFFWSPFSKNFKPYIPLEKNLEAVPEALKCTTHQLEEEFNQSETSKKLVYGQITFEKPLINQWLQLPALSTCDTLLNYAAEHPDFELKRCKNSGYYFIKFKRELESCLVNYIIEPGNNVDFTLQNKAPKEHLEWISKLSFDVTGALINNNEYQKLLNLDETQRIQALAEYCRFEEESATADIKGNAINVLNSLIKQRAGVCRHRAQLFSALAFALQIDASLKENDVHQFVLVRHKDAHFTLDLGGGVAHLIDLPMPPLKKRKDEKTTEDKKTKKTVSPLKPDNRFQTWNSVPLQALNAGELVKKLTSKNWYAKQWLIFKDNHGIEALHQASTEYKNTFFSRDLDSMVLRNLRVEHSLDQQVDSPISQFLKNATLNPNESYTWFINWSDPKARHVSLNSIIDKENPNLGNLPIPPNVHVVVGMDERSAFKMGDDFYSRFNAISQAPDLPPIELSAIKLNQPVGDDDVLFPSPLNWESIFLGRHTFNEGTLGVFPGALMKAAKNKTSKLTVHNAPFEDPKFRFLITELMATNRFFFNGEWHELSKDFHLEFAQPDLSTYPDVIKPIAGKKRIVNQTTLPLFSNQYKITENHTLKPLPGFFALDQQLELLVTDNLTEIQWYSLLREAQKAQCTLNIKTTPNVFVPEPLKKSIIPIDGLGQSNQLIITNDLDDAEEHYKPVDAITINIDPKTNFNSLFFHVSLKNKLFKGEETELLKAIKSGKAVVLKGQFSTTLAQQLQTLFINPPTLWVNGEVVSAQNITLISDNPAPFKAIHKTVHHYKPEKDFARLHPELAELLKKTYQQLKLTPCHSHFIDLPTNTTQHSQWLDGLIRKLKWSAGILPESEEPTTPEMVLNYLDHHPLVFLTSKTGTGKSYFVQKILPKYGKEHQKPIIIYHELAAIKNWLEHKGESQPILFIDEANLSQEHYALFEALARGDKEFWYEGTCYPLKNHKIIFAGNPTHYEGRFEPNLIKRYPNYLPFEGQPLKKILAPLLESNEDPKGLLKLIEAYYIKAQDAGLNITPRNAQMMCLRYFILKENSKTKLMTDDFLIRYAILSEIKTLSLDKKLSLPLRYDIKQGTMWSEEKKKLKTALQQFHPKTVDKKFIWTDSRKKIALSIEMLLLIREKKIKGVWDQELGINGIILEAEPGLGKSQLVHTLLKAKGIEYITIFPTNPQEVQAKLLDAFHKGQVVCIEEFNTQIHEQLLNALLSGYDLEGNPPKKPGFCLIGTQNPTTFHGRLPLSKALDNRLMLTELSHYKFDEFIKILTEKFKLLIDEAQNIATEYFEARTYAQSQSLFPPPNPRNVMNVAEEEQKRQEILVC